MILGTAGHIDHGKTSLVRALTGVDTDRLPEEKRRGITIELGFAPLALDGMPPIGVVDVPGHEAFVRTMLAGATGIDLALVVIAADEGVMPQTREHLAILDLLGVGAGVVALTKSDLVEDDWMQLVEDEVRALLRHGSLASAQIVRCSATTGDGLPELKAALAAAARAVPSRTADDLFRMPIDRAFSVKGTGTVVTGTVWSGTLAADDHVVLLPAGTEARVRGAERHGQAVTEVTAGVRAAIALAGVERRDIDLRGTVLVRAGDPWVGSSVLRADAALQHGASAIGPRTRVRFHLGTVDVGARIVTADGPLASGGRVAVRIALDAPVVARAGDRFVVRSSSPPATVGGGVVTDPDPPKRRARPWPRSGPTVSDCLAWMLTEASGKGIAVDSLPIRLGVRPSHVVRLLKSDKGVARVGDRVFDARVAKSTEGEVLRRIDATHRAHPLEPGIPVQSLRSAIRVTPALVDAAVAALIIRKGVTVSDGLAARADWTAGGGDAESRRTESLLTELIAAGPTPPSVDELALRHGTDVMAALKLLVRRGELVQVAIDRFFSAAATTSLISQIQRSLASDAQLSVSELRAITGLTRKYLIPILEYCDREGRTIRRGDFRVLGPRSETGPR